MKAWRIALVATLGVALVAAATSRSDARPARVAKTDPPATLGVAYGGDNVFAPRATLAWFDPMTLKMLPGRKVALGGHVGSWAFSSDRSALAVASCAEESGAVTGIRFVNARVMRPLGDLSLGQYRCVDSLTWLAPRRLLAVARTSGDARVLVVDPVVRRVLRQVSLPGDPWATAHSRDALVLLFGGTESFTSAQLKVVDAEGNTKSVSVDRVLVGNVTENGGSNEYGVRIVSPGLAVDPEGRAFLVPATGPVADIDVATLTVSYHDLQHPSLLRRLFDWLTPAAAAKSVEGEQREAAWAGEGKIVVSGSSYTTVHDAKGAPTTVATPAGTTLIDTQTWRVQKLSEGTSGFAVSNGVVIAEGGTWSEAGQRSIGPGLEAFGLDGRKLWQLHPGEARWIDPAGAVGYVPVGQEREEVVDLVLGEVVANLTRNPQQRQWPTLLARQSSSW
jgi:hypothetical protein